MIADNQFVTRSVELAIEAATGPSARSSLLQTAPS
jgi:hypothetical protein